MMEGRKVMSASKQASKQDIIIIIISEAEHWLQLQHHSPNINANHLWRFCHDLC
jgi:hypothetical protein